MDFQSAMETFAEAWAAANTVKSEVPNDLSQVRFNGILILCVRFFLSCTFWKFFFYQIWNVCPFKLIEYNLKYLICI